MLLKNVKPVVIEIKEFCKNSSLLPLFDPSGKHNSNARVPAKNFSIGTASMGAKCSIKTSMEKIEFAVT